VDSAVDTTLIEARPPDAPTKAPNGKLRLLSFNDLDGRTLAARRAKQLIEAIETDLGGGDRLSQGQKELVKRAAVLGAIIASSETQWLSGDTFELGDYLAAINAQRRILATLGLERRSRDVTPSLDAIIAEHEGAT
jgi:glutathione S-transferase